MQALIPFLIIFAVVAVVVLIFVNAAAARKRREAMFAAAAIRGWTFTPERPDLVQRWTEGAPFGTGDSRRARDVLSGVIKDREFEAFTYSYETSSTDSKGNRTTTTHRFAVVALALPAFLPTLEVTPESVFHRALDAIGIGSDIDLESEDFNRAYRVSSKDPKFASDLLPPKVMERLLAGPRFGWRVAGPWVLTWSQGTLDVEDVDPALNRLQAVVSGIPDFVWKDHGYDPADQGRGYQLRPEPVDPPDTSEHGGRP